MGTLKRWTSEVIGYVVSFIVMIMPQNCQEWTNLFALLIAFITLMFITIPKAAPNIKKFWKKIKIGSLS